MSMTPALSRALAIAILALVTLLVASAVVGPAIALERSQAAVVADKQRQLQAYERVVEGRERVATQLDSLSRSAPSSEYFVSGETAALGTAAMQQYLRALVGRNNAELISTQVATGGNGEGEVLLVVHVRAQLAAAMNILYGLESGKPMLFVDDLVITARPVRAQSPGERPGVELDMQFEIAGYMRDPA